MSDGFQWDPRRIELAFALLVEYSTRSEQFEFRSTCKGIVNQWYGITPPAMGRGAKESVASFDSSSHLRGVNAIRRDLLGSSLGEAKRGGVFAPLADSLINSALDTGLYQTENVRLFVKKTGEVYGTEKALFEPDAGYDQIRAHHKAYFKNGRMTSAGGYTRDIGRWKFINRLVIRESSFDSYMEQMIKKVGWLASSLNGIARLTGARIPSYARDKSAPAAAIFDLGDNLLRMKWECLVSWGATAADGDMARRFQNALEYQANAMFRRIPKMMEAAGKRAGLKVAA